MRTQELLREHKELRQRVIEKITELVKESGGTIKLLPNIISVDDQANEYGEFCYIYKEIIVNDNGAVVKYGVESDDIHDTRCWISSVNLDSLVLILKLI